MTGLKDRQRLALYVALGLSAGSGLTLDASTAYASTIPADTTTPYADGVSMGATNGNKLTIGAVGGDPANHTAPMEHPVIGKDVVGGIANDARGNDIIIESIKAVDADYGRVYGAHAAGTVEGNSIKFHGGVVNELIGAESTSTGTAGTHGAQRNIVTVTGGKVQGNVTGGIGGTYSSVNHNIVSISNGEIEGQVNGGAGGDNATVTGNEVTISGGNLTTVNGGIGKNGSTVNDNTVTVTGGTFGAGSRIVGGETGTTSTKSNANKIILGSAEGAYTAQLDHTEIWGSRYDTAGVIAGSEVDERIKENTLTVNAQNVAVDKVRNFEKYKFNLNKGVGENATMLTVADANGFGNGANVQWSDIQLDAAKWNDVKNTDDSSTHYGKSGTVTLIKTSGNNRHLSIHNSKAEALTRTGQSGDFEYKLATDNATAVATAGGSVSVARVEATLNRIQNADAVYAGSAPDADNAVRGGYSEYGHDVTKNILEVTHLPSAGLGAAYGGEVAGLAGSLFGNMLDITGTDDHTSPTPVTRTLTNAYGGAITNANNAGAVGSSEEHRGNRVAVSGGQVTNVYGGYTVGAGNVQGNAVYVAGGTVTNVYGGAVDKVDAAATKNKVQVRGGKVTGEIAGARAVYDTTPTATHTLSNGNNVMLGAEEPTSALDMNVAGASIYGTDYRDVTSGVTGTPELTFDSASDQIKGNELTVTTTGVSAKKVRNFDSYTFILGDNFENKDTMLTLTEAGGFGTVSVASNPPVKVDWTKVKANTSKLTDRRGGGIHGRNTFTLMQEAVPGTGTTISYPNDLAFANYADTAGLAEIDRVYEKKMTADGAPVAAGSTDRSVNKVLLELNRFRDDEVTHDGTAAPAPAEVYGGYSGYDHTEKDKDGHDITVGTITESNILNITGVAHGTHDLKGFGGYTAGAHGGSVNNIVNVDVDELPNHVASGELYSVYGGYAKGANAGIVSGNTVRFSQGATLKDLMGGYIDSTNLPTGTTPPTSDVVDNHVIITGGTVGGSYPHGTSGAAVNYLGSVYGGRTDGTGDAHENTVYVNSPVVMNAATPTERDATIIVDKMVGGYGATATDNDVTILSGTVKGTVYGGYATTAGTPEVPAGVGISAVPEISAVRNNTVTIGDKAEIKGDVYGAYAAADASNMTAATDSNTINLYKAVICGTIYGGMAQDAAGHDVVSGKNNTLAVHGYDSKAGDFAGVQNLNFYLPEDVKNDPLNDVNAPTMLKLTNVTNVDANGKKDLSNIKVGVELDARRAVLHSGDNISLMTAYNANTPVELTPDHLIKAPAEGHQDALRYKFELVTVPAADAVAVPTTTGGTAAVNNKLIAKVTEAALDPQTKSLVETRAASMAFINSGSDLLTDAAMTAAMEAAATPASESQAGRARVDGTPKEYGMWAVQNVSSMRLNSGSHVDAKGWGLNLGFAKQRVSGRNTLTYGPFVEYGKGSYDSYLDDGLHGSGDMDYLGVGVMAKSQSQNGAYVEGSVRVGRVKSDYAGTIADTHRTYDSSSTYYAGHLGVGQEKQLKNGNTIDTYAKYFFAHQGGDTVRLSNGAVYDFDAANSHRIRFGTRYTSKKGDASFYTGLAYEYEFGDDFAASYQGYNTPSPSLTGGTGILELGYRFAPQNGRATYGIQLMGMTGQRRGISGGVQMHWAF
ncbi:autotransporter outer membrane beta-barrel domain-containing protein [Selenomonas sp. oral taxon 136]|uniref:autotransporter outer membrane beta-barrel domain-containing protein n=1 Tax=Selenomonas sp. oral taxon 136 TaxID=713030 RepID=UPI0007684867|nr:autotransporter outer membrane beta-barrel domain-containing protein [Selenomonas sp. oral taxon 136]AME03211.1 hypothetical protein AXE86_03405 [Selenomonas sp. oral taxon 136]